MHIKFKLHQCLAVRDVSLHHDQPIVEDSQLIEQVLTSNSISEPDKERPNRRERGSKLTKEKRKHRHKKKKKKTSSIMSSFTGLSQVVSTAYWSLSDLLIIISTIGV